MRVHSFLVFWILYSGPSPSSRVLLLYGLLNAEPYLCTRTQAAVQLSGAVANGATVKEKSGCGGKGAGLVTP